jgi:hypothetical protein
VQLTGVALISERNGQGELKADIHATDYRSSMDVRMATVASTQLAISDLKRQLADPLLREASRSGLQREVNSNRGMAAH